MVEAFVVAEGAKQAVTSLCAEEPATTELSNSAAAFTFSATQYVAGASLSGSCKQPLLAIETRNTGASPDPLILLSGSRGPGSNRIDWICTSTGSDSHMPEDCRR